MKKQIGLLLGVLLLIGATGCGKEPQKQDMTGAYNVFEGYLTVKDNQLIVDEIKFIDLADKYWIDSLNLTEEDMTNGYYIYNPMYTTQEVSELLKKFDAGNGELGKTPFEIQVLEDGRVISIREIFIN